MQVPGATSLVLSAHCGHHSSSSLCSRFFCALGRDRFGPATLFSRLIFRRNRLTSTITKQSFARPVFAESLINSAIVAGSAALISLAFGSLCAYALARLLLVQRGLTLPRSVVKPFFPAVALLPGLFVLVRTAWPLQYTSGLVLTYLRTSRSRLSSG